MSAPPLELWVVYERPADFPEHFVARKWLIDDEGGQPTKELVVWRVLDELREELVARGLSRLPRLPADDPAIVETWI